MEFIPASPVTIQTRLMRVEVIERLRALIPEQSWWQTIFAVTILAGRVEEDRCWFVLSRRRGVNRRLLLAFVDTSEGTSLKGEFAVPLTSQIAYAMMVVVALVVWLIAILGTLTGESRANYGLFVFPSALFALAYGIFRMSLLFAGGRERELVEMLEEALSRPSRWMRDASGERVEMGEIVIRPRHERF